MAIAQRSLIMRMHATWVLGCSFGLTACFLSDFREAERRERERMWVGSQRDVSVSERADAGAAADGDMLAAAAGPRGSAAGSSAGRMGSSANAGGAGAGASAGKGGAGKGGAGKGGAGGSAAMGGAGSVAGSSTEGAAGDGAAGKASSSDAGATGASCGDTTSDVEHCGRCDNDCNADMALASCVDSRCVRACASGYGDCNADLAFGDQGDGCEIDLANGLAHCGSCGSRCELQQGAIVFCEDRQCQLQAVQVEGGNSVAELHGNAQGGDPYEQLCGRDEAQVGIDVASDGNYVLGLAVRCAPLWLTGSRERMVLDAGPSRGLPVLGNRAGTPLVPVALECPPGTLLSGVSGATGNFTADNTIFTIKALSLHCARPNVSDAWVELEPSSTQSAGSLMGNVVDMFSDNCPPGEAVVGFIGRAGHLIDALSTLCAPVAITQRAR